MKSSLNFSDFLSTVHPSGHFELVGISQDGGCFAVACSRTTAAEAFDRLQAAVPDAKGFYFGLNPAKTQSRLAPTRRWVRDVDIENRTLLMVDIDNEGKTPEERGPLRERSLELARRIVDDLTNKYNFPEPIIISSGNGAQIFYRIAEPTECPTVHRCLVALAAEYNTDGLEVDTKTSNPSRIGRLPETWNRKYPGEHRMAKVVSAPEPDPMDGKISLVAVPHDALEALAAKAPADNAAPDWNGLKQIPGLELDTDENREQFREWLKHRAGGIEGKQGRTNLLETARFGGDFGLTADIVLEELTTAEDDNGETYNDRCDPPWELEEMATVIRSSYKGRKEPLGCKTSAGEEYRREQNVGMFDDGKVEPVSTNKEAGETPKPDLSKFYQHFKAFDEFEGVPAPPEEWIVPGLLTADADLILWAGAGGSGKTTLTTQLSQTLVQGGFFPLENGNTPGVLVETTIGGKPTKIAYISTEESQTKQHRRYEHQSKALPTRERNRRYLMNIYNAGIELFRMNGGANGKVVGGADWEVFKTGLIQEGINILFIDNLSNIFPGNENERDVVSSFCNVLYELNDAGIKIILLAHTNKAGAISGSSGWLNQVRQAWLTTSKGVGENRRFKTEITKDNGGVPREAFYSVFDRETWCHKAITREEYDAVQTPCRDDGRMEEATEAIIQTLKDAKDRFSRGEADSDAVSWGLLRRLKDDEGEAFGVDVLKAVVENLTFDSAIEETTVRTKNTKKGNYGNQIKAYRLA